MFKQKNTIQSFGSLLTTIIMVLAIVCFINIFINHSNKRFDFTKNNIYTLSSYSKTLVSTLNDIITIEFYITEKLPPHAAGMKQQIIDLLNEYDAYGKGNIQVIVNTLNSSRQTHNKMAQLGIPKFQMNIIEQDTLQTIEAYSGIALFYENKTEVIPFVLTLNTLEYDLSLALKKITSTNIPTIGILTKNPENLQQNYNVIIQSLEKQYQVTIINQNNPIPATVDTLVINNPKDVTSNIEYTIDQFIMNGGNALFLINSNDITNTLEVLDNKTPLKALINHYGVTIGDQLVLDQSFSYASFSKGFFKYTKPYPLWPKLIKQHFNSQHPSLKNLESFVLPWSSPIIPNETRLNTVTLTPLASTTKKSWLMEPPITIHPNQSFQLSPATSFNQHVMIASLEGKFQSFFDKKPLALSKNFISNSKESKLVFIGNSEFATNPMIKQFPNNKTLYLNIIDWLTLDNDLLGIPNRTNIDYPIKRLPPEYITIIKWFVSLIIPIIMLIIGGLRYWMSQKIKHTNQ